jgi:aspartate ammonia-lyase
MANRNWACATMSVRRAIARACEERRGDALLDQFVVDAIERERRAPRPA